MNTLKSFIKEELSGWKKWEILWLLFACITIVILSLYWKDSVIGIISATTGVASVVCAGKGKLSSFIFGIVNVLLYVFFAITYKKYLQKTGICNVSFIGMMAANDYCREQYINPGEIPFEKDERFRIWNCYHDHEYCRCSTGDYHAKDRWIRYYYRSPGLKKPAYARQLVYTGDNRLWSGFGGEEIDLE